MGESKLQALGISAESDDAVSVPSSTVSAPADIPLDLQFGFDRAEELDLLWERQLREWYRWRA